MSNDKPKVVQPPYPMKFMFFDMGKTLSLFNNLIRQRGYDVEVAPHVICPCVVPARSGGTSTPVPDCPSCHGQGIAFLEDRMYVTRAVVSGITESGVQDARAGLWEEGRFMATFQAEVDIEEGDRLRLVDAPQTVRLNRKYRAATGGIKVPFKFFSIARAASADPSDRIVRSLVPGQDYTAHSDKRLVTFPDRGRVADGAVISFLFEASPYFLVQSFSNKYRGQRSFYTKTGKEGWMSLPKSVVVTRADKLFGLADEEVSEFGGVL